jgi:probable rRNA maturation factor
MIYIDDRQNKINVTEDITKTIEEVINFTLKKEQFNYNYEISLIFIDNEQIKIINKETRNIDRATDVLSFPMLDYEEGKVFKEIYINYDFDDSYFDDENLILGDIALSLERAEEQRQEYNHSFLREICYLIVHSILHLLGYDHMKEEDKTVMRNREEEILNELKIFR